MKLSSTFVFTNSPLVATLVSILLLGCGSSSAGATGETGGVVSILNGGASAAGSPNGFGGQLIQGGYSSALGGALAMMTGGASSVPVNPTCVANGACTGAETCTSACQNDTSLAFACTCNNSAYVCDTRVCNQPNPCRAAAACTAAGATCLANCPAVGGVASTAQYTCTCAVRAAGASAMTYGNCNEATACVASCAMGAQTAGSNCTTAGDTCTYANASGTIVTCACGGAGATRFWTCR